MSIHFIDNRALIAGAYADLMVSAEDTRYVVNSPMRRAESGWRELAEDSVERAAGIRLLLDVEEVPYDEPYSNAAEMCGDIWGGHFMVSTTHCEHPLWTPAENVAFRIVHDVLGHYAASVAGGFPNWTRGAGDELRPSAAVVAGFDWEGETRACGAHAPILPSSDARRALFTECLGQTAYAIERGRFPEQAVGYLDSYVYTLSDQYNEFINGK